MCFKVIVLCAKGMIKIESIDKTNDSLGNQHHRFTPKKTTDTESVAAVWANHAGYIYLDDI